MGTVALHWHAHFRAPDHPRLEKPVDDPVRFIPANRSFKMTYFSSLNMKISVGIRKMLDKVANIFPSSSSGI